MSGLRFGLKYDFLPMVGKLQLQPAKDIVHDRAGMANVRMAAPAGRLEASVGKFVTKHFQRYAVLQADRDGLREAADKTGNCGTFFRHRNEEFSGLPVWVESDRDVPFMTANLKFVGDGDPLVRQSVAYRLRRRGRRLWTSVLCRSVRR
jgi:hypothetical protein